MIHLYNFITIDDEEIAPLIILSGFSYNKKTQGQQGFLGTCCLNEYESVKKGSNIKMPTFKQQTRSYS